MARSRRAHGGSVRRLASGRWQVRVHDKATGDHVAVGTFATKADAVLALTQAVADQSRGGWVPPERGRVTLEEYAQRWLDGHAKLAPRSRERYAGAIRLQIVPHLGQASIGDITTATLRRWHAGLHTISPSTAAKAYRVLRAMLNTAVDDGLIMVNPCRIKGAGVERTPERPIATVAEIEALADAVPPRYRVLVLLAAWSGLRLGELSALTRADVDLDAGTVTVNKSRQRLDDGTHLTVPPKSAAGYRKVTLPPPLVPLLAEHLELYARDGRDALVFTVASGAALDRSNWGHRWRIARAAIGRPDLRFHDLRHTGKHPRGGHRRLDERPHGPHGPRVAARRADLPARYGREGSRHRPRAGGADEPRQPRCERLTGRRTRSPRPPHLVHTCVKPKPTCGYQRGEAGRAGAGNQHRRHAMADHEPLLTIAQAAELLGVTERWVRRAIAERRIPFCKIGRYCRFRPTESARVRRAPTGRARSPPR